MARKRRRRPRAPSHQNFGKPRISEVASGCAALVADAHRAGPVHHQRVADLVEGAEHDRVAGELVGQAHLSRQSTVEGCRSGEYSTRSTTLEPVRHSREHGAVVDAFARAAGNRDHVVAAARGEHVRHRQHLQAAVVGGLLRRMQEELQVVGLRIDRQDAVADADLAAFGIHSAGWRRRCRGLRRG